MKSNLELEYLRRRERYLARFASAYRFLRTLEDDPCDNMWLSTSSNAHLYKGTSFLAYIVLSDASDATPSLTLSPHMNQRIVNGTVDRAHLLFPEAVCCVLERHAPERIAWWTAQSQGRFELRSDAPAVVFEELLDAIRGLAV